jgi:hypothetical protein
VTRSPLKRSERFILAKSRRTRSGFAELNLFIVQRVILEYVQVTDAMMYGTVVRTMKMFVQLQGVE